MCRDCYHTTAASFSPSLAMTNPELIWSHHQEQKQRAGLYSSSKAHSQPQSSSASTYSESTTYSYDKEKSHSDTKQKRSMRQRVKDAFKDMGSPPRSYDDRVNGRQTEDQKVDHGPMSSSPLSRT
ncbi:hypothetical protein GGS26DRAFT_303081 [Hypomontagnella submonticulosa]|nr:hypothetical protein GGS26DRAFT_303081 [Hypomontagnella submonticulosa]